jgi:anaerobic carbon-monoxide dehydrogenase catalytic subunit
MNCPKNLKRAADLSFVNSIPTVTEAPNLVKLLTQDCAQVTGGRLNVETDRVNAVGAMLAHIEAKRKKLGIYDV